MCVVVWCGVFVFGRGRCKSLIEDGIVYPRYRLKVIVDNYQLVIIYLYSILSLSF